MSGVLSTLLLCLLQPFPEEVHVIPVVSDAVSAAAADVMVLPEEDRRFQRYVWVPPWSDESWIGATNLAIQIAMNRDATLSPPVILSAPANGSWTGWVLRYDLRTLAHSVKPIIALWDSFALDDPYLHVTTEVIIEQKPVSRSRTTRRTKVQTKAPVSRIVPILSPHIDSDAAGVLSRETNAQAPVYRGDWLIRTILTTVDGGRYYDCIGITGIEGGIGSFLNGIGVSETSNSNLQGDKRVYMIRSNVTGKKRRVDRLQGILGGCWLTRDISSGSSDVASQADYNLLDFAWDASEIIAARRDGLHYFLLADGKGGLQTSVPDDIAIDHTVPVGPGNSGTARLQPAISCIRCHGPEDGLISTRNDLDMILRGRDLVEGSGLTSDLERVAGLYADTQGFNRLLQRGRDDYFRAVSSAASLRFGMLSSVKDASRAIADMYASIEFTLVTPYQAVVELGYRLPQNMPPSKFLIDQLSPREDREDVTIVTLQSGNSVARRDWERVYTDVASRLIPPKIEPSQPKE